MHGRAAWCIADMTAIDFYAVYSSVILAMVCGLGGTVNVLGTLSAQAVQMGDMLLFVFLLGMWLLLHARLHPCAS